MTGHGRLVFPEGARRELARKVAGLKQSAVYPDDRGPLEAIETHMSWVFLTAEHAYKLKKPIRTRLLDYSTLEHRERACHNELRLNRRLAPDVYLGVVPLCLCDERLRIDGEGEPVDWLVEMRRLSQDQMLDVSIEHDAVWLGGVDRVASALGAFYEDAESAAMAPGRYCQMLGDHIAAKARLLRRPRYGLDDTLVGVVVEGLGDWIASNRTALAARGPSVVDAHGDLRPEHICLENPPVVIDCLDFDRGLRLLDPVSELAFLALECEGLGAEWIGRRLLKRYARRIDGGWPDGLVDFYQAYHCLVRAGVAVWHLEDHALDHTNRWMEKARRYLGIARRLLQ